MNTQAEYKVLHIAPTPFFADRGCHIRIRNEIESLADHPVTVILCTYQLGNDIEGIDIRRIMPIPGYRKLDAGFSPFKFPADILLFFLVLKICFFEKPVLLHGHLHEGALIGWAVKIILFWRSIPLIMDMQGSLSGELSSYGTVKSGGMLSGIARKIEAVVYRLADYFLCSSGESRNTLLHGFHVEPDKTALLQDVVPDVFFDVQDKKNIRKNLGIDETKKVVLYTGSLLPGKGVYYVFEAMKELSAQRHDIFFVLVGYPKNEAEEVVRVNGLTERVLLPGQVKYSQLPQWLAVGDVALEPKESDSGEASGKLLHYMAAGLPVVCFSTSNNKKILGDAGYYAELNSRDSFVLNVVTAMDDSQAATRGMQGQKRVRESYSMTAVGKDLFDIYLRMISPDNAKA